MDSVKYIGLDVHRDTISVAVVDQSRRLVMQSVIPTQVSGILERIWRGSTVTLKNWSPQ